MKTACKVYSRIPTFIRGYQRKFVLLLCYWVGLFFLDAFKSVIMNFNNTDCIVSALY